MTQVHFASNLSLASDLSMYIHAETLKAMKQVDSSSLHMSVSSWCLSVSSWWTPTIYFLSNKKTNEQRLKPTSDIQYCWLVEKKLILALYNPQLCNNDFQHKLQKKDQLRHNCSLFAFFYAKFSNKNFQPFPLRGSGVVVM